MLKNVNLLRVRDHIPLEQGLRLSSRFERIRFFVRDHIPLEQGLRLSGIIVFRACILSETIFH